VKPHNRAFNIPQPPVQSISFPQIYGGHPCPSAPIVALIVGLDSLLPKFPHVFCAVLAKANVNKEVAVIEARFEVGSRLICSPLVNGPCASRDAVPAPELTGTLRLKVHRCS
jgi:hypothetical protein